LRVEKKRIPIRPGLFEYIDPDNQYIKLIGCQCIQCGEKHFPTKNICPACSSTQLKVTDLSQTGVIKTYTVIRQPAPGWAGSVPYIIGVVLLDDGVEVGTHLTGIDPDLVRVGVRVRSVAGRLFEDPDGNEIIAHMYRIIE